MGKKIFPPCYVADLGDISIKIEGELMKKKKKNYLKAIQHASRFARFRKTTTSKQKSKHKVNRAHLLQCVRHTNGKNYLLLV